MKGVGIAVSEYAERYVAFVDILGFRELVMAFAQQRAGIAKRQFPAPKDVYGLLQVVHTPRAPGMPEFEATADFRAQSISDAVAMSSSLTPEGLDHIFFAIRALALQLLDSGILIRGAITKGRLWHDDSTVFGEGLVRAYELESKVARFPRVMITQDVAEDVEKFTQRAPWKAFFKRTVARSNDGPHFLHVLDSVTTAGDQWLETAKSIQAMLQNQFNKSADNPSIFEKVRWFSQYWNWSVPGGLGIVGPGLVPLAEMKGPP